MEQRKGQARPFEGHEVQLTAGPCRPASSPPARHRPVLPPPEPYTSVQFHVERGHLGFRHENPSLLFKSQTHALPFPS
jgi:hypothetical protein